MKNVAQTILDQLGGKQFKVMTGANNFVGGEDFLQFGIGRGAKNGINKIKIILTTDDRYNVDFYKIRGTRVELLAIDIDVYADRLAATFTEQTGFDTRL